MSSRIDLSDHHSHFDASLSPYNFLRFDDRRWRLANSSLLFQNRLRRPDEAVPDDLAEGFRAYEPEDLAVVGLRLVAVPSPDAPEEPENVVG